MWQGLKFLVIIITICILYQLTIWDKFIKIWWMGILTCLLGWFDNYVFHGFTFLQVSFMNITSIRFYDFKLFYLMPILCPNVIFYNFMSCWIPVTTNYKLHFKGILSNQMSRIQNIFLKILLKSFIKKLQCFWVII